MKQRTIGSILLDVELVTQEDIEEALEIQKQTGQRLGEVLVSLGVVSDDDIRWALAEQLNLPYVNIRKDQIDTDVAMLIPEKLARRYHIIPILKIDDELTVVVDDPLNDTIIKDIESITRSHVKVSLGRTSDILLAIDEIYGRTDDDAQYAHEAPPRFISGWFSEDDMQKILNDPSGYALVEAVLENALAHKISRIYFQPGFKTCHISYRVNGLLQHQIELGKEWYSIALFRLKISAGMELLKTNALQTREISYWNHILGKRLPDEEGQMKFALSIFPVEAGESAVLQLVNKPLRYLPDLETGPVLLSTQRREREELTQLKATLQYLKTGAILMAGAPYADKIATLYTLLQGLDPTRKRIMTLEAYTEYSTDAYTQIRYGGGEAPCSAGKNGGRGAERSLTADSVKTDREILLSGSSPHTLSSWLTTVNQQDVDVILVDNLGTQNIVTQCFDLAAHHVLLGTFEFKQVFDVLAYCLDCQIKPSVLAARVYALIAQQTVYTLCEQCKQPDTTEFSAQFLERVSPAFTATLQGPPAMFLPKGCPACHQTGYTDRVVLFEVLKMETWLKDGLGENMPLSELRKMAEMQGFVSFEQACLELLLTGKTSIEQILSIVA